MQSHVKTIYRGNTYFYKKFQYNMLSRSQSSQILVPLIPLFQVFVRKSLWQVPRTLTQLVTRSLKLNFELVDSINEFNALDSIQTFGKGELLSLFSQSPVRSLLAPSLFLALELIQIYYCGRNVLECILLKQYNSSYSSRVNWELLWVI